MNIDLTSRLCEVPVTGCTSGENKLKQQISGVSCESPVILVVVFLVGEFGSHGRIAR